MRVQSLFKSFGDNSVTDSFYPAHRIGTQGPKNIVIFKIGAATQSLFSIC